MGALFLKLANLSITACWMVLAVLLIRLIFRKAPKWIVSYGGLLRCVSFDPYLLRVHLV